MSTNSVRGLFGRRPRTDDGVTPVHTAAAKGMATLALTAVAGLAITGTGVYALLRAQAFNASPETVASGQLLLNLSATSGSQGFTTGISGLAPGDTANRFVDVKSTGSTIDGTNLTLQLADSTPTALTTDATNGLKVTVTACSQAWTMPGGTCGGTTSTVLAQTSATAVKAAPQQLVAGTVGQNATQYLRVGVFLPDTTEVTVNGVLPGGSIQNKTATLTWTFSVDQRAATTTNT